MGAPRQSVASVAQAVLLWRSGRQQEAQQMCELLASGAESDAAGPGHGGIQADALSALAEMYTAAGRTSGAVSSLRKLAQLKPQDASVWRRLGYAELTTREWANAVSSYRRAVEIEPNSPQGHNNLGQALMGLEQRAEAIASYRRATGLAPGHAAAHNNLGIALYEEGDPDAAIESYRRALALDPKLAHAHHNCGNALLRLGRLEEALECYERALELKPGSVEILCARGDALAGLKRFDAALASYERGLQIDPQSARLLGRAGGVLRELKRPLEALAYQERAWQLEPQSADAQNKRAAALGALGRFDEALVCCERALTLRPDFAEAFASRAFALRQLHRYEEALTACERALEHKPDFIAPLCTLAEVLVTMGQQGSARDTLRRILELEPNRAEIRAQWVMSHLPAVPRDLEEVSASRAVFADRLAELGQWLDSNPQVEPTAVVGSSTPFLLAYQPTSNRGLLAQHGTLCCELMSRWARREGITPWKPTARVSNKVRVGIVSAHIRDHSVYQTLVKGWLGQLDRRRFEVGVLHLGLNPDQETRRARVQADFFMDGVRSLPQWVDAIRSADLDVLVFPEIGMHALTLQLASLRLVPHQLAAWGHPETTGLPTIDYYLSAQGLEPPEAQDHYSEKLMVLPNLGCYYEPYGLAPIPADFDRLGIAGGGPVFMSAGMPFKYAPQHDHVFVQIARRLERCRLVFFTAPVPRLTEALRERLSAAFRNGGLDPSSHLVFVPWQNPAEFFGLMRRVDVLLDTIDFSGFNTIMQAIECDLPLVAYEGRFMRGRFGSGIVRRAGLPDLIARTCDEYVELAVRLATDHGLRDDVRERMKAGKDRLFRDRAAIDGLEEFLVGLRHS
jgi:protein O-GlcNAc transferase